MPEASRFTQEMSIQVSERILETHISLSNQNLQGRPFLLRPSRGSSDLPEEQLGASRNSCHSQSKPGNPQTLCEPVQREHQVHALASAHILTGDMSELRSSGDGFGNAAKTRCHNTKSLHLLHLEMGLCHHLQK